MIVNTKESYYNYLVSLVSYEKVDANQYDHLLRLLHGIEFTVLNPMDANRLTSADSLRNMWIDSLRVKDERLKLEYARDICNDPASFLEVVIGLCRQVNDNILADPNKPDMVPTLFWDLMDNMVSYGTYGSKYTTAYPVLTDDMWNTYTENTTIANVKRIVTRTYHPDGSGGLFPLKDPKINQRKEEMWTCCIAYVNENYVDI